MSDRDRLITAAQKIREAGNLTVMAIMSLEHIQGDRFSDTIVELRLQAGDLFVAADRIDKAIAEIDFPTHTTIGD